jgi:putative copper resistance protein D
MHALSASVLVSAAGASSPAPPGPLRWSDLVTEWRPDPIAIALVIAAAVGYVWYRVRAQRSGIGWARRRDVTFTVGLLAAVWVCCGVAQVRAAQVEWIWMAQLLGLLLVVPLVVLAGQPVQLSRAVAGEASPTNRIIDSRLVRTISHPLIGPALVPIVFLVLLFGGVGQSAAASPVAGWVLHLALLLLGAAIALPLVDTGRIRTSLGVGLALAVGFVELIVDVFPGIVLRLLGHPVIGYFVAHTPVWEGGWLHAQQDAGGLLWMAAEVLDLPFVVLLMIRWSRVDAAEAAAVDARLDAEEQDAQVSTRPWFLDDPQLRDRYQH